jgi:Pyruvate/2-oxoacid:ferredoxin oxidoreductase delta subunit
MFGEMINYYYQAQLGWDNLGLGRWVVMTLRGETTRRIICGYNPCGNYCPNSGMVYHQQHQYWITKQGCLICLRVKFQEDLVAQLKRWREQGDKLIVCLDANKDVYRKLIGRHLL